MRKLPASRPSATTDVWNDGSALIRAQPWRGRKGRRWNVFVFRPLASGRTNVKGNFRSGPEGTLGHMEVRTHPAKKPARLKEALERSQRDLEDFFENGVVGLHWVASDGSILRVNQAELDLLGYTREEYVGRHIAEFHADKPVIDDILARLTRGEKLDKYGARLKAKDGSIKHVLISSNVHFRDGRFINTRCFTLDVTDLKKAETALRESDQRLRATHERAFAGIAEVDLQGRFLRANTRFCEITGYSADELLNCGFGSITHPEDAAPDIDNFAALVSGQTDTYQLEKRFLRKDGTTIWVAVSASIVRDDHGQPLYGIRIVQDITELKRSQARQKMLLDELNHRVKNMLATVRKIRRDADPAQGNRSRWLYAGVRRAAHGAQSGARIWPTQEIGTGVRLRQPASRDRGALSGRCGGRALQPEGPLKPELGSQVAVMLAMALGREAHHQRREIRRALHPSWRHQHRVAELRTRLADD